MSSDDKNPPSAWVWSEYRLNGSSSHLAHSKGVTKPARSKYLYAAVAIVLLVLASIYKESNETYAPHQLTSAEIANSQIEKALKNLNEAYKVSPREETEKLINQIRKIPKD
jgi:hypothetical protein